ncbi:MAG TPA: hypothetical protein VGC15_06530 [Acetobacteraceae bacterium]
MSRRATLVLGAMALVLAGVLRWQVQVKVPAEALLPAPVEAHADGIVPPAAVDRAAEVAKITGRPVFEPSRRPSADVALAAAAPVMRTVPRVTGVVVTATDRSAIFAPPGAGAATVAREGGQVGEYTVQRIAAGQVTLMGPDGPLLLRPVFDKNRPLPPALPPAPPLVVGLPLLAPPLPIQR